MSILEHKQAPTDDAAPTVWLPNRPGATVRTYRGKSLEALTPKIRRELGPDAVILREREGLIGGVGGFFATRFVEVEARAGSSIDVYDEDDDLDVAEMTALTGATDLAEATDEIDEAALVDAADGADSDDDVLPAPAEFSARLQEAVEAWSATADEATAPVADEGPATAPQLPPVAVQSAVTVQSAAPEMAPVRAEVPPARTPAEVAPAAPDARRRTRRAQWRGIAVKARGVQRQIAPAAQPAPAVRPARPMPGRPVDLALVSQIVGEMVSLGASEAFARDVVNTASVHSCAVSGGLRAAARSELARRLSCAPNLPAAGCVIGFVGTGGSGKTLATAALASSYRTGSPLPVSVASLGDLTAHRRLADTLRPEAVPVTHLPAGEESARHRAVLTRIAAERQNGLVVLDTPTASPADTEGLERLAQRLEEIGPDRLYVVLSATLNTASARQALSGLSRLRIDGIVISHADETDQVGVLIELAAAESLPVVYRTAGTDHRRSLTGTDPAALAHLLLP